MGRETKEIRVTVTVSRHLSEQDNRDDAALDDLRWIIEKAVEREHRAGAFYSYDVSGP